MILPIVGVNLKTLRVRAIGEPRIVTDEQNGGFVFTPNVRELLGVEDAAEWDADKYAAAILTLRAGEMLVRERRRILDLGRHVRIPFGWVDIDKEMDREYAFRIGDRLL